MNISTASKIFDNYISNNKHIEGFVNLFKQFVGKRNPNVDISVYIGKRKDGGFTSYLSSTIKDLVVKLSELNGEPQIYFADRMNFITCINLEYISDISINTFSVGNYSICYDVYFTYNNEVDYCFTIKIK